MKGGVLEPISYDLDADKYFDKRTPEEVEEHYKELNDRYRELIRSIFPDNSIKKVLA